MSNQSVDPLAAFRRAVLSGERVGRRVLSRLVRFATTELEPGAAAAFTELAAVVAAVVNAAADAAAAEAETAGIPGARDDASSPAESEPVAAPEPEPVDDEPAVAAPRRRRRG